jgi:hypothetical protein
LTDQLQQGDMPAITEPVNHMFSLSRSVGTVTALVAQHASAE